jgi:hydrogenase/urease accessory protein HupE
MFIVRSRLAHEAEFREDLLTADQPLEIACSWDDAPAASAASAPSAAAESPPTPSMPPSVPITPFRTARQYTAHGLHHILTGYDHLLFVAALVIGATSLWDLVKVVTAFALAHTLTLSLSVLGLVRLPSSVVEPVIAASIVFVALQNVFFPRQSRGTARLAIAFAFGLFHGLGFAGGLLEAMEGMPAINLAIALIAFTVGVELAHQVLIIPLYFLLRPLRRPADAGGDENADASLVPMHPPSLRFASLLISAAGVFYLVGSLRGA